MIQTPVKVIRSVEMIYELINTSYSDFSFFKENKKVNFEEKLKFVKSLTSKDISVGKLMLQQRIMLAKIIESIMKEIDSPFYKKKFINPQTDLNGALEEYQNQLKNVYAKLDEKDNRILFHYSLPTTYSGDWNNFTRVSRGFIVDLDDYRVVAHPYDKFYNFLEKRETRPENLPNVPYEVSVKLDGSEGILYPSKDGSIRIITKGGFDTEQGKFATKLLWSKYTEQANLIATRRLYDIYTMTFEILYAKDDVNRIVVAYDEPDLRLIGVRDLRTGKTLSYSEVIQFAKNLGLPHTDVEEFTLEELLELRKDRENFEGWVVRFENELYMKIKCEAYLELHGARFGSSLRAAFFLVKDGKWDDFIATVPEEIKPTPLALYKKLMDFATHCSREVLDIYNSIPYLEAQKEFAKYVEKNVSKEYKGFMYQLRANKDIDIFANFRWDTFRDLNNKWIEELEAKK